MAKVDVVGVTKRPKERIMEAVQKAVEARLKEVKASIKKVGKSLENFETKHKMSTEIFYKKYSSGELEENLDFMEWRAAKKFLTTCLKRRACSKRLQIKHP